MNITLVGQPNVGKSLLFSRLTGKTPTVSNYPRTTVDFTKCTMKERLNGENRVIEYIDTPGLYSINDDRDDANVTKKLLESSDLIINVICGPTINRDIYLTKELTTVGKKMIIALNFMDVIEKKSIKIELEKFKSAVGVPVILISAKENRGIEELKKHFLTSDLPKSLLLTSYSSKISNDSNWTEKPIYGTILSILSILMTFYIIIKTGNYVALSFEPHYVKYINDWIQKVSFYIFPELIANIIAGKFGALTMGLELCIVWVLPFVVLYSFFIAIFEDIGILARFMVGLDWILKRIGLSGSAITPPILACGCNVVGVVGTRACKKTTRIRCIQFIGFAIPCSAQLGAATVTLNHLILPYLILLLGFGSALTFISSKIIYSKKMDFEIFELPPYQLPNYLNLIRKIWSRIKYLYPFTGPM